MYQIDQQTNNLVKLEKKQFGELGFREREHLQEWIAKNPEVLGEELLIIQKEFNGFNDTNERLDLLAINKRGELVVIENKLDDTGRDVTWQALKYTSYCSTLKTDDVIRLYQLYLNKHSKNENATELLREFLEQEEGDLILNTEDQRIIFVANNYRKEVTSTVLWLIDHDVKIKCFRATPYSRGKEIFLQIEQIIPLPETAAFMIDAKEKEREDKGKKSIAVAQTEERLIEFWRALKEDLEAHDFKLIQNVTPNGSFSLGSWSGPGKFGFCIGRYSIRVELYFSNDEDKKWFDAMHQYKNQIESKFDGLIEWQRLENKKASRIRFDMPIEQFKAIEGSFNEKTNWDAWILWFRESMVKFHGVLHPVLKKVSK